MRIASNIIKLTIFIMKIETLNSFYVIIRFFNIVINLFDFAHSKTYALIVIIDDVFKYIQ